MDLGGGELFVTIEDSAEESVGAPEHNNENRFIYNCRK